MLEMLSLQFMQKAFIVGILISLCAALLGITLVLRRFSMMGDGLSHVGFGALALAAVLNLQPLTVAIPVVIGAAFLLMWRSEKGKTPGDAGIALLSSSALAIGILLTTHFKSANTDLNNYMFGSIFALSDLDVWICIVVSIVVITFYLFFYHNVFAVTFDESFAQATGSPVSVYRFLISLLTALVIVIGMRLVGALLISSLIIFPALSAMRICRSYRNVIVFSCISSVFCCLSGILFCYFFDAPPGASIVAVNLIVYLACTASGFLKKRFGLC